MGCFMAGLPSLGSAVLYGHSTLADAIAWITTLIASATAFAIASFMNCSFAIIILSCVLLSCVLCLVCLTSMPAYLRLCFTPDTM